MKYRDKDHNGLVKFSNELCTDFLYAQPEIRDAMLMDMFGELDFDCGHTRWDNPISWTHLPSRRIVIQVYLPQGCDYWDRCPHVSPSPNDIAAFVSSCGYEVVVFEDQAIQNNYKIGGSKVKSSMKIHMEYNSTQWLVLPQKIRAVWNR